MRGLGRRAAFDGAAAGMLVATAAGWFSRSKYQAPAAARDPRGERRQRGALFGRFELCLYRRLNCRRGLRLGQLADLNRIDVDRLGNILELGCAEIADLEIEPLLDLAIGVLGRQIAPGFATPSSRAAILTPSPIRSPSASSTTSPR